MRRKDGQAAQFTVLKISSSLDSLLCIPYLKRSVSWCKVRRNLSDLGPNLHQGQPLICMLVDLRCHEERNSEKGLHFHSLNHSSFSLSKPITPQDTEGDSLLFFIHALLHPFSSSQSPSAPNTPSWERDAEGTLTSIIGKKRRG